MKNNTGITLVALIITVAVIIILAGVSINVTSDMQGQMKFQAFKTQLDILQIEVIENYENTEIVTDEMKIQDTFFVYTPEELEDNGFTKTDQDAYINWKTRQVKMYYKGQEYYSDKYNVESNIINENNTNFNISMSYVDKKYKVKIEPIENVAGLEVSYRAKTANNWVIVNGYEFEYVAYGIYEVRLRDKNGNETIKTINQTLETVTVDSEIAKLDGTLGEDLVNYKIYGQSLPNGTPTLGTPVEIESIGDLVTNENDENYGKYKISINVDENIVNIYIDEPLRKLGNYSDDINFENSNIIRRTGIFNVAEYTGWMMPSSNDTNAVFCNLLNTSICDYKSQTGKFLCTHLQGNGQKGGYQAALNAGVGLYAYITTDYRYLYFVVPLEIASTVTEWENFVDSADVEVAYILNTEENQTVTLPTIKTQQGTTSIYIEDETIGLASADFTYIKTQIL